MISLPASPPAETNTVEAVLGDDLSPQDYGAKWILHEYDTAFNKYTALTLESPLEQGRGYWITQITGQSITLDLPVGSTETPNGYSIQMASSQNGANQWNLLGYPFSSTGKFGDFAVQSTSGVCSNPACDISQAKTKGLVEDRVWTWTNNAYSTLGINDSLPPWQGFWAAALQNSSGQSLALKHKTTPPPSNRGITNNDPGRFEGPEPQNIIDADTGNNTGIIAAINRASAGDTVRIPEGTWEVSEPTIEVPEGISLMGVRSGGEIKTILKRKEKNDGYIYEPMLRYSAKKNDTSKPFKVSNIKFIGVGSKLNNRVDDKNITDYGLELEGALKDFIIVNNEFTGFTVGVHFIPKDGSRKGYPVGVIAKNKFEDIFFLKNDEKGDAPATGYGVSVAGPCLGKETDFPSCKDWDGLFQPGTNNAVFIEDNYFTKTRHAVAGHAGGRYVFRYNEIKDNIYNFTGIDAHGERGNKETPLSTRSYEIYHNLIQGGVNPKDDTPSPTWAMGLRGGGGVIFNNDMVRSVGEPKASDLGGGYPFEKAFLLLIEGHWVTDDHTNNRTCPSNADISGEIDQLFFWGNRFQSPSKEFVEIESLPEEQREVYFTFGTVIYKDSKTNSKDNNLAIRDCTKSLIENSVHYEKPEAADWTPGYNYQPFTYPHPLRSPG